MCYNKRKINNNYWYKWKKKLETKLAQHLNKIKLDRQKYDSNIKLVELNITNNNYFSIIIDGAYWRIYE